MKKLLLVILLVLSGFFGLVNAEGETQASEQPAAQAPAESVTEAEAGKKVEASEDSAQAQEEPAVASDAQQQEDFQNMVKELNDMMSKEGQEASIE